MSLKFKEIIKKALNQIIYFGFNYVCPMCGYKARKLMPAGLYERRANAMCPKCTSLERHRFLYLHLNRHLDQNKNKNFKVLHFAPEKCFIKKLSSLDSLSYYTSSYPKKGKANFNFDVTNIEMNDNSFDILILNHVLEHVEDDITALNEIKRVLKPNGICLIMVPLSGEKYTFEDENIITPEERTKYFGQYDHVRFYGLDFKEKLQSVFNNVNIHTIDDIDKKFVEKYRLVNTSGVFEPIYCVSYKT